MLISDVLRSKSGGSTVATVGPEITVRALLAQLAEYNFGALVVSNDGTTIAGIVSERDIVRRLHEHGLDFYRIGLAQHARSEPCGVFGRKRKHPLFDRQDLRRMHRILTQPHAEQQLGHFQLAGELTADRNR